MQVRNTLERVTHRNRLLTSLAPEAFGRISPYLDLVDLHRRDILFRAHDLLRFVYFPLTTVISLVGSVDSGATLEVGLVGHDGIAGTAVLPGGTTTMPCDGIVQIAGKAYRMDAEVLRREVALDRTLHTALTWYIDVLLGRSMQMLLCNNLHSVEQRCIRWLLTISDLVDADEVPLTHDLLATMLGVRRPTVSVVLRTLQRSGLIEEKRGRLGIRDRAGLEAAGCECYAVLNEYLP